jgi:hypothetical protein
MTRSTTPQRTWRHFSPTNRCDFQRRRYRGNSWLHDIGSNRLYAAGRLLVHLRQETSRDKVPRQCRF